MNLNNSLGLLITGGTGSFGQAFLRTVLVRFAKLKRKHCVENAEVVFWLETFLLRLKFWAAGSPYFILFIFLGHLFPVWIRFKGGKGIAVIIGCLLGYNFFYGLIFSLVWLVTAVVSKYSSLSALVASLSILIIVYLENDNIFLMVLLMVTMIFLKHISNIRRLLKGNELRINLKK